VPETPVAEPVLAHREALPAAAEDVLVRDDEILDRNLGVPPVTSPSYLLSYNSPIVGMSRTIRYPGSGSSTRKVENCR
jgi:hypothetical protein